MCFSVFLAAALPPPLTLLASGFCVLIPTLGGDVGVYLPLIVFMEQPLRHTAFRFTFNAGVGQPSAVENFTPYGLVDDPGNSSPLGAHRTLADEQPIARCAVHVPPATVRATDDGPRRHGKVEVRLDAPMTVNCSDGGMAARLPILDNASCNFLSPLKTGFGGEVKHACKQDAFCCLSSPLCRGLIDRSSSRFHRIRIAGQRFEVIAVCVVALSRQIVDGGRGIAGYFHRAEIAVECANAIATDPARSEVYVSPSGVELVSGEAGKFIALAAHRIVGKIALQFIIAPKALNADHERAPILQTLSSSCAHESRGLPTVCRHWEG